MIKVLSFPSRHPYMSKFDKNNQIKFVNPNTDYFNKIGGTATPKFINKKHPPDTYDLVHIHFSFDKLSIAELKSLLDYFKHVNKPIIWTCHNRESTRRKNIGRGKLQKLLFDRSDALITLTNGCKKWMLKKFGNKKKISVIPLGYMASPKDVSLCKKYLDKKRKGNFVYLVGEPRENKEIIFSIEKFLKCPELFKCSLTVITKPVLKTNKRIDKFLKLIHSSDRIKVISLPDISNELINKVFGSSHVCVLPYLWGTHSGQVELSLDCGCHPVVSNVGFYKEQSKKIVEFKYNDDLEKFSSNFIRASIKAYKMPFMKPGGLSRKIELEKIIKKHIEVYESIL